MNVVDALMSVRAMEKIARELSPLQEVIDAIDAREMDDERNGRPIPRDAIKFLRPVLVAARDFQSACRQSVEAYMAAKGGGQ